MSSLNINNLNLTLKVEEECTIPLPPPLPPKVGRMKQGIVSILGSDSERNKAAAAASIRRTLSADMSSKKWLSQNGFSPMKKIASSEELVSLGQDDVWRSIQNDNKQPTSVDVWSSILSQKKEESPTTPPPYIHPLIKKTSSLTEKSLEICTESLGSETGSEISFPSYPPSETGDIDEDKNDRQQEQQEEQEEVFSQSSEEIPVVKYNKKSSFPPKSFPPPIPSLARDDNSSVQMQSHRQNGRLILEAVSVPPQNLFRAQRLDGRLLLSLINTSEEKETEDHHDHAECDKVFNDIQEIEYDETHYEDDGEEENDDAEEEDDEEEAEEKENGTKGMQIVLEQKPRLSNGGTLMMKQIMGLEKKKNNLTWSNNFNKAIPQSIPMVSQLITSPNPPSAAASFNAYEYFWRKNPTVTNIVNNYDDKQVVPTANGTSLNANSTTKVASYEQQDVVLMRGNKANINYLVPMLKGCKEQRRSLLFWEPYCIATS